jgi:hypothetical protein
MRSLFGGDVADPETLTAQIDELKGLVVRLAGSTTC